MKMKLIVGIMAAAFTLGMIARAEEHKSCCEKAKADGKECTHPCCVKAKADGKVCEKCNPPKAEAK